MNLANLTALLLAAFCALSAAISAYSAKGSFAIAALFALGGLVIGVALAVPTRQFAYHLLKKESALSMTLYLVLPVVAISASSGAVVGISHLILR
jgi:hypothetical protein